MPIELRTLWDRAILQVNHVQGHGPLHDQELVDPRRWQSGTIRNKFHQNSHANRLIKTPENIGPITEPHTPFVFGSLT